MNDNIYINSEFDDFDDLAENLCSWEIEIHQLQCGKHRSTLQQLSLENVQIGHAMFPGRSHQVGQPPARRTFAFHTRPNSVLVWRKQYVSKSDLMIFPSASELDVVTMGSENTPFTVSMSDSLITSVLTSSEAEAYTRLVSGSELVAVNKRQVEMLSECIVSFFELLDTNPAVIGSSLFESNVEDAVLCAIVSMIRFHLDAGAASPPKTLSKKWHKIEGVLENDVTSAIRVNELSGATGVSVRTLGRLFRERYGVAPKTYLKRMRLNKVRRELKRSSPSSTTVAGVARSYEFTHMGQFTADYKQLFGELPSKTLMSQ